MAEQKKQRVGLVGLGAMGLPMCQNLLTAGYTVIAYDVNPASVAAAGQCGAQMVDITAGPKAVAAASDVVITMVPNDNVLENVVTDPESGLLASKSPFLHISCSTVSPETSRRLALVHKDHNCGYVGAPVFARADGMARREASFAVGGEDDLVAEALPILNCLGSKVYQFGSDPGAGNVVKLCGNFMIASAIETCAEMLALAEKNDLDRKQVMDMFSETIFDCLIFKGYGGRVAARQHTPNQPLVGPGFALELGHKDLSLCLDTARKSQVPMPFASVLHDRFLRGRAQGLGKLDWSAIALGVAEDAGLSTHEVKPKETQK